MGDRDTSHGQKTLLISTFDVAQQGGVSRPGLFAVRTNAVFLGFSSVWSQQNEMGDTYEIPTRTEDRVFLTS